MKIAKKAMYYNLFFGVVLVVALAAGASPSHAALGVDFTTDVAAQGLVENGGPNTFEPTTGYTIVGWSFTPTTDLYLTRLGVYDADRDRRHTEQHLVGIWSADRTLLSSVAINEVAGNVPEASPNGALFHFADTSSPVLLSAGQNYFVGATLYAGQINGTATTDFDSFAAFNNGDSPVYINPNLVYNGNAYAINATNALLFPSSTFASTDFTIGANIDVTPVPIPAAFWLFGSGLLGLVGIKRRKGRAING